MTFAINFVISLHCHLQWEVYWWGMKLRQSFLDALPFAVDGISEYKCANMNKSLRCISICREGWYIGVCSWSRCGCATVNTGYRRPQYTQRDIHKHRRTNTDTQIKHTKTNMYKKTDTQIKHIMVWYVDVLSFKPFLQKWFPVSVSEIFM